MSYPIMPSLPLSLAKGLSKSPNFNSVVQQNAAGMGTSSVAVKPYATWDFSFDMDAVQGNEALGSSAIAAFMGIMMACQGRNNLFLWTDPQDNTVVTMPFGTGDGVTTKFQLSRQISGATDIIQNVNGSIQVFVNGALTSVSISSTGVVTFSPAPAAAAALTWTGSFYFLCRFSSDTVDSVRSFTTNNGIDQWNVSSVKFSSEFVAAGTSGVVYAGGGSGGIFLPATPLAVLLNPTGAQTITSFPLAVTGIDSETANVATAGFISLANSDAIDWRNHANTGNLILNVNTSDQLVFNGTVLGSGGGAVTSVFTRTGAVVAVSGDYSFSLISGTATSAQLPTPTTSAIGGVKAITAVTSKWVNSIATTGTPTLTQPAFTDVSGSLAIAQINATGTPSSSTFLRGDGTWSTASDVSFARWEDDFMGHTTGTISSSGNWPSDSWWVIDIVGGGTTGTMAQPSDASFNNPGVVTMTTPATSGNGLVLYKSGNQVSPVGALGSNAGWQYDLIVALNTTSNICIRVGFGASGTCKTDAPSSGMWIEYDTANGSSSGHFTYRTASSSVSTYTSSGLLFDTSFHHFRIRSILAGTILYSVDGGTESPITSNVSTLGMQPFFQIVARSASAVGMQLDYCKYLASTGRV